MAVDIDLYHCDIDDLKEHIEDHGNVGMDKLELYIQEMMQLIDDQKARDKQAGNYYIYYLHYICYCIK